MDKPVRATESEKSTAVMNSRMGLYIFFTGLMLIAARYIWGTDISPSLAGAIAGGGLVYWGVNYDKVGKLNRKLDDLCYRKYGKSYKDAYKDIAEDEGY
ncbi:hypothetical protein [Arsenophonus nasoniae]|uniref:Uncharacterized protein n=1 Tax=Arsenophonus nasoniae TaxID=638 RepID=A0AA95GLJ6_9GAMM|nr:hypothetical protein [Arsenophonus nasoniae]WGL96491.1 hypothetical protein QE207_08115 [Arsenophonus nasoniae]